MNAWTLVRAKQTQLSNSICAGAAAGAARTRRRASRMFSRVRQPLTPGAARPDGIQRTIAHPPPPPPSARGGPEPSAELARQFEVWG